MTTKTVLPNSILKYSGGNSQLGQSGILKYKMKIAKFKISKNRFVDIVIGLAGESK
jgi:hypothetical protein